MASLLTPEDSKRVADEIIKVVQNTDLDIAYEVREALLAVLQPEGWKGDWLPLLISDMAKRICDTVDYNISDIMKGR